MENNRDEYNGKRIRVVINEMCEGSVKRFAEEMGESSQNICSWLSRNVGYKILKKIFDRYPEISREWLQFGIGDIYKKDDEEEETASSIVDRLMTENKALREEIQDLTAIIRKMVEKGLSVK